MTVKDECHDTIDLHIRWSDRQDLIFKVSPFDTMAHIKEKIRQLSPRTECKYIRLIHNGRILDDTRSLYTYGIGKQIQTESKAMLSLPSPVYLHCSLSDYIPKAPVIKAPQSIPAAGLDRLRESGFTEEDIQAIRTQFHRLNITNDAINNVLNFDDQCGDNETCPEGTLQGTYQEMVWGLILGFFLGIICLFWFRESVFTRRHQMGIITGMLINISFGVLHVYY
ncbi:hypothetical protein EC973_005213 [Apophysomyces ossiformis]|uniref:Ubiquitin-like domain-containing protein n=1 Tax=Apophysomyces ossiformis TaxID=679940 RepID=A0A8H7BW25_9FUNG|nr:hypothetical protein EC973_005213 [Apophysomyces ossiformis]